MAERPITQRDVNDAYRRGHADAERELLPFHGVGRVGFLRDRPHFAAALVYEESLRAYRMELLAGLESARIEQEHAVKARTAAAVEGRERVESAGGSNRVTTLARRTTARVQAGSERSRAERDVKQANAECHRLQVLLREVTSELEAACAWLDEQVEAAAAYGEIRAGLRRAPSWPAGIPYSVEDFIAEDPEHRQAFDAFDAGGADYGYAWTWEPPDRPWEATRWRISWLDNGEIYARDITHGRDPAQSRLGDRSLLLLGVVPRPGSLADNFLADLERSVDPREGNSLLRAAETIAEHVRARRPPAHED